ncbi:MAG: response regulator [Gammaproteobacteria bacterium]
MSPDSTSMRKRVLFVDDEPRILVALKMMFRSEYEVLTANSGAEALEIVKSQELDVIVSDQRMPQMTGVELLRSARELRPRAIRVLLTGYSDLSAVIGAINDGEIFRFVSKPWTNTDLRATVAAAAQAAAVDQVPVADTSATLAPAVSADGVGILVLDEDKSARAQVRELLGNERPVYLAANLDEAVDALEHHRIGVIVTELIVDGETVTGLLAALRRYCPSLVAIVLAAQADAAHSIDLINHGQIYRFLRKPISEGLLRGSINLAIRRYEILQKHPEQTLRITVEPTLPPPAARQGLFERIGRLFRMGA